MSYHYPEIFFQSFTLISRLESSSFSLCQNLFRDYRRLSMHVKAHRLDKNTIGQPQIGSIMQSYCHLLSKKGTPYLIISIILSSTAPLSICLV